MDCRALRRLRPARQREIGPFVVEYVFSAQSLVVELAPDPAVAAGSRARVAFLNELGYSVLLVSREEVRRRPRRVVAQIEAALR